MKVKELRDYLAQFDDYEVICSGYADYAPAVLSDIDNPSVLRHDKKWFIPCASF